MSAALAHNENRRFRSWVCRMSAVAVVAASSWAHAQAAGGASASTVDGVEVARQIFEGRITGNQVTVRSGPSENYYPVTRLDSGTIVVVNGIKFDWLRIAPPEGSFSLIAKQFVEVSGTGARVVRDNVNVRAGSLLNTSYQTVQTRLMQGDPVVVLGEVETRDGVFLKIKPPPGAYLFVKKDFVVPVRAIGPAPAEPTRTPRAPEVATTRPVQGGTAYGDGVAGDPGALGRDTGTGIPGTAPAFPRTPSVVTADDAPRPPTTQELATAASQARAEADYDAAEKAWMEAMNKPLAEQPLPELLQRFNALAVNEDLPITLRSQAESTAGFIKARNASREAVLEVRRQQAEMQARLAPLQEQNRQLREQFLQMDMTVYTAAGQLQTSTLQEGGHPLLRLVDPSTLRTLVYIRRTPAGEGLVGQFVGVKGSITRDEALNVQLIVPTTIVTVDPNAMGRGISAEIMPPSMRPAAPATPATPATPGTTITPIPATQPAVPQ